MFSQKYDYKINLLISKIILHFNIPNYFTKYEPINQQTNQSTKQPTYTTEQHIFYLPCWAENVSSFGATVVEGDILSASKKKKKLYLLDNTKFYFSSIHAWVSTREQTAL